MKRWFVFGLVLILLLAFVVPAAAVDAAGPTTYTVAVGWENAQAGIDLMAFFPDTLRIHVGDTVHWVQQSNEIHTVTFLAGAPLPPLIIPAPAGSASPIQLNPMVAFPAAPTNGQYDGSSYANSGIMGMAPGQAQEFSLTFTKTGTFDYVCVVHGVMMSGKIVVVGPKMRVPSQAEDMAQAAAMRAHLLAQVPSVFAKATSQIPKPVRNPDGTMTRGVLMGYEQGQIMLMRFFPSRLYVRPGDTVTWQYAPDQAAPHTVTFLNGAQPAELVLPVEQPSGPPLLLVNPEVFFPSQAGQPLSRSGIFNSGLLEPPGGQSPDSYSLKIGDITGSVPYVCLLHDESGMVGSLEVASR